MQFPDLNKQDAHSVFGDVRASLASARNGDHLTQVAVPSNFAVQELVAGGIGDPLGAMSVTLPEVASGEERVSVAFRWQDQRFVPRNHLGVVALVGCCATVVTPLSRDVRFPYEVDFVGDSASDFGDRMAPELWWALAYSRHTSVGDVYKRDLVLLRQLPMESRVGRSVTSERHRWHGFLADRTGPRVGTGVGLAANYIGFASGDHDPEGYALVFVWRPGLLEARAASGASQRRLGMSGYMAVRQWNGGDTALRQNRV